jgi:DNA-binding PadR family transcriptional regulator
VSITSDLIRGSTDTIILAELKRHDSYGYQINKSIQEITHSRYELKEATLYSAFRRLEESGLIYSYWGDESTGARRKYYTLTSLGRQTLERNIADWQESKEIIDKLIEEEQQ